jgi:hypothetical protein
MQESGSGLFTTELHWPVPATQVVQGAAAGQPVVKQQIPSLHAFELHWASDVQTPPAATCPVHFPVASQ